MCEIIVKYVILYSKGVPLWEQEIKKLVNSASIKIFKAQKETIEPLLKTLEKRLEKDYIVTRTSDYIINEKEGTCHIFVYVEPRQVVKQ